MSDQIQNPNQQPHHQFPQQAPQVMSPITAQNEALMSAVQAGRLTADQALDQLLAAQMQQQPAVPPQAQPRSELHTPISMQPISLGQWTATPPRPIAPSPWPQLQPPTPVWPIAAPTFAQPSPSLNPMLTSDWPMLASTTLGMAALPQPPAPPMLPYLPEAQQHQQWLMSPSAGPMPMPTQAMQMQQHLQHLQQQQAAAAAPGVMPGSPHMYLTPQAEPDRQASSGFGAVLGQLASMLSSTRATLAPTLPMQVTTPLPDNASEGLEIGQPEEGAEGEEQQAATAPAAQPAPQPAQTQLAQPSIPLDVVIELLRAAGGVQSAPSTHTPHHTVKEADRINLGAFPQSDYRMWREAAMANIIAASVRPQETEAFISAISDPRVSDFDLVRLRPPAFETLDAKIYSAILCMLTSKVNEDTSRIMVTIQQRVCAGSGRQALRALDADFMTHGPRRRQVLLAGLYALKPVNDVASIEPTILKIRQVLLQLKDTPDLPSDGMVAGMLRFLFQSNSKVAPILASFDLMQGTSSEHLLGAIERLCIEHRASTTLAKQQPQQENKNKALAATETGGKAGDGKGRGKGKEKGKNKGKDKGKKKDDKKKIKCGHCGRAGHDEEHCFFNPASPSYKGAQSSPPGLGTEQMALAAFLGNLGGSTSPAALPAPTASTAASSLPSSASAADVESFRRFQAAHAAVKKAYGMKAANFSQSDALLLDSGATWHITGQKHAQVHPLAQPVTISTVQGDVQVGECATIANNQLQSLINADNSNLEAIHVPGAPEVGSLGKLIKDYKLTFTWRWDDYESPMLVDVEGRQLTVSVESDCPMLAAASKGGRTTSEPASAQRLEKPAVQTAEEPSQFDGVYLESDTSKMYFDMDEPEPVSRFLGMEIKLYPAEGTKRKATIGQNEYCNYIIKKFKAEALQDKLRKAHTPANDNEINELGVCEESDSTGLFLKTAPSHIGSLLYLMRCLRFDIAVATAVLGRYVTKWSKPCDSALTRVFAYLDSYPEAHLEFIGDSRDFDLTVLLHVDSDHGGDKLTSHSVSGADALIVGEFGTRALIAWKAKHQTGAVTATGAAEVTAGALGLKDIGLPLMSVLEMVFPQAKVRLKMCGDAEVAEHVFAAGRSKALRYLRKHHRISIHFVYDVLNRDDSEYVHVGSKDNPSDIFTKPLPIAEHHAHVSTLGLVFTKGKGLAVQNASIDADKEDIATDKEIEETIAHNQEEIQEKARRRWVGPDPPESFRHLLMHLPGHPDCDICKFAKIVHAPARRQKQFVRVQEYGLRFYLDLIGPIAQGDIFGNRHLLVGRDEFSDFAMCVPIPNKASSTVADVFKQIYPLIRPIRVVRPDWGGEFEGRFEAFCRRHDIDVERGIARRPQTFSREERWHRTLEEGTRAALYQSGMSHRWFSLAAMFWTEHWNRVGHGERTAPIVLKTSRESTVELHPFGSLVICMKETNRRQAEALGKFEPRGELGILVGYGSYNSYKVLRLEPFVHTGAVAFRVTRDVKFPSGNPRFPIRDIAKSAEPFVEWHFLLPCEQEEERRQEAPIPPGTDICKMCGKFITTSEATCPACCDRTNARRRLRTKVSGRGNLLHVDGPSCSLRRCDCLTEMNQDQAEVEEITVPAPMEAAGGGQSQQDELTLADIVFEKFSIDGEQVRGPPSTVDEGFEEPDEAGVALAAHLAAMVPEIDPACYPEEGTEIKIFAMVYRGVKLDSEEAKCVEAQAAIDKELNNMIGKTFADFSQAKEKREIADTCPESLFVYSHLLLGVKDSEVMANSERPSWKARLVAGGNYLHDIFGAKFTETDLHGAPASLEGVRLVVWRATMSADCELLQADVNGAYLQALLRGRPTYIELPKRLWPKEWFLESGEAKFKHPVLKLIRAIYGLRRSGFDWMEHASKVLQHHGWQPIHDVADSLFIKMTPAGPLLLCCYVDDLLASGPGKELRKAMHDLRHQ